MLRRKVTVVIFLLTLWCTPTLAHVFQTVRAFSDYLERITPFYDELDALDCADIAKQLNGEVFQLTSKKGEAAIRDKNLIFRGLSLLKLVADERKDNTKEIIASALLSPANNAKGIGQNLNENQVMIHRSILAVLFNKDAGGISKYWENKNEPKNIDNIVDMKYGEAFNNVFFDVSLKARKFETTTEFSQYLTKITPMYNELTQTECVGIAKYINGTYFQLAIKHGSQAQRDRNMIFEALSILKLASDNKGVSREGIINTLMSSPANLGELTEKQIMIHRSILTVLFDDGDARGLVKYWNGQANNIKNQVIHKYGKVFESVYHDKAHEIFEASLEKENEDLIPELMEYTDRSSGLPKQRLLMTQPQEEMSLLDWGDMYASIGDIDKATEFYKKFERSCLQRRDASGLIKLARIYNEQRSTIKARELITQAERIATTPRKSPSDIFAYNPSEGNELSEIADLYREGKIVPKDLKKAFALYKEASDNKDLYAMYRLGEMYEKGEGVKKDLYKAVSYYQVIVMVSASNFYLPFSQKAQQNLTKVLDILRKALLKTHDSASKKWAAEIYKNLYNAKLGLKNNRFKRLQFTYKRTPNLLEDIDSESVLKQKMHELLNSAQMDK